MHRARWIDSNKDLIQMRGATETLSKQASRPLCTLDK